MNKKKVTICASMSFADDVAKWVKKLAEEKYDIIQYPKKLTGDFLPSYKNEFSVHYQKITESDIVLALNMEKKGVAGYVGAAVFAEIAFAIGLNRSLRRDNPIEVYCLNEFPDNLPHSEEMRFWLELGWLKLWK